jgi:hypothetical protein
MLAIESSPQLVGFGDVFGLGITKTVAEGHAKKIAMTALLEPVPPDKELAEQIMLAVMNLNLPSIADEKQVLNLMAQYGVKQSVVTLALASVPPYEDTTGTTTTTKPPGTSSTTTTRVSTAKKNIQTAAGGLSKNMKIGLGIGAGVLAGLLLLAVVRR